MKTGLYFGTFNPVHVGHMVIAGYFAEFTDLGQVWMVLTPQNPLKEKAGLLSDYHRMALLRRAVEDSRKLKVSDIELGLPQPSYTIDTLTHLSEKYPDHQFVLLLGSDNLENFHKWKNHEEILKQYELYVYPRTKKYEGPFSDHPKVKFVPAPLMEISATFIRNAIRDKKDVSAMLPGKVWEYVKEMHFYEK